MNLEGFYICSFSSRTIVYKGLFNAPQVRKYFIDLKSPKFTSALAVLHQRYSTNTFPTWHLAHPFRQMAPQWRNQHHPWQPQPDAGTRTQCGARRVG